MAKHDEGKLYALLSSVARKLHQRVRGAFSRRSAPLLLGDLALATIALTAAHILRFGPMFDKHQATLLLESAPLFAVICAATFIASGLYTIDWRYATLVDMLRVPHAAIAAAAAHLTLLFMIDKLDGASRLAVVISVFVMVALLVSLRLAFRADEVSLEFNPAARREDGRVPVLLVGAGSAADNYLRAIRRDARATYRAVGVLDVDGTRVGMTMRGVPILGTVNDTATVLEGLCAFGIAPKRLIFTEEISRFEEGGACRLLDLADERGITVSRLPRPTELRDPRGQTADELRPIEFAELLERPQATLPRASVARVVAGRRILVTGAGGSIGSELSSQLAALEPAEIVIVDSCELNIYAIDLALKDRFPATPRSSYICDVRDRHRVDEIFLRHRPEVVFHAAALKHVPLVELNPAEGVLTNVIGSRNVAQAAKAAGAFAMVQVSTDKAVNTCNVMGATKRIAELYCQALDLAGVSDPAATRFMTVRFGNVLGSSGSLIPLFQRQLAHGGPLTVTDPEMKRFFMTIREAVQLTLQTSTEGLQRCIGQGAIFVLDMGQPIRVVDIARRMIRLAGLVPDKDVAIEFIGARPGEKLFEELFDANERRSDSRIPGVMCAEPTPLPLGRLNMAITKLEGAALQNDVSTILEILRELINGYQPSPEAHAAAARGDLRDGRRMAPRSPFGLDGFESA